jgi:hypothetical protein
VFFIAHSANGLPSVKFDTRQKKWFAECFSKIHSQRIIVCRVFLGITLGKPIFQRKKYFFSQHTIVVCRVFLEILGITLGKPIFQRKNNEELHSPRTGSLWSYCSKSMGYCKRHETFISNQIPSNPKIDHTQVRNWLFKTSCYHFPIRYHT